MRGLRDEDVARGVGDALLGNVLDEDHRGRGIVASDGPDAEAENSGAVVAGALDFDGEPVPDRARRDAPDGVDQPVVGYEPGDLGADDLVAFGAEEDGGRAVGVLGAEALVEEDQALPEGVAGVVEFASGGALCAERLGGVLRALPASIGVAAREQFVPGACLRAERFINRERFGRPLASLERQEAGANRRHSPEPAPKHARDQHERDQSGRADDAGRGLSVAHRPGRQRRGA